MFNSCNSLTLYMCNYTVIKCNTRMLRQTLCKTTFLLQSSSMSYKKIKRAQMHRAACLRNWTVYIPRRAKTSLNRNKNFTDDWFCDRRDVMNSENYHWEPGVAFCTAELKKASLKKSREPLKTTLALFLAWRPAISRVFLPTAWGYWWNSKKFLSETKHMVIIYARASANKMPLIKLKA